MSTSASSATRSDPGKHSLVTENIPVLTKLKSWKYGFESPFKVDIYFVTTRLFTGNKWGTSNPIMLRDKDFGIVRARAFGTYDFKVTDPKLFLKEVAGSDHNFRLDEFADTMRSRIVSIFSDALATSAVPVLDVATRYSELGEALLPLINPLTSAKYGIEIASFIVENVSVPPEVEEAIDKRSSMAAIGNLNDFVKYQMAKGFETRWRRRRRGHGVGTRGGLRHRAADDAAGPGGGAPPTPPVAGWSRRLPRAPRPAAAVPPSTCSASPTWRRCSACRMPT